jgi:mRNA-degrading endonuclease RelE of RelBE toxin-antitoxin system
VSSAWSVRVAKRVLIDDVPVIGYVAYERAKKAIKKKLTTAPEQYGEMLHAPLHGLYKLKSSHVRVAYHIEAEAHEVWVLLIGDRQTIWDTRQGDILERLTEQRTAQVEDARRARLR